MNINTKSSPDDIFRGMNYTKQKLTHKCVQYRAPLPDLDIVRIDYHKGKSDVSFYTTNTSVPFDGWVNIEPTIIIATAMKIIELMGGLPDEV